MDKEIWYRNVENYSATTARMTLEDTLLSEISQKKTNTLRLSLICEILKKPRIPQSPEKRSRVVVSRVERGGNGKKLV